MGNWSLAFKKQGGDDEENSLASSAAEAAAKGARQAVLEAVQKAQKEDVGRAQAVDPEAAAELLVAGVLPLPRAQAAAASVAERGLDDMARDLQPAKRLTLDFKKLKSVASSGASGGVKVAADVMVGQQEINQEVVAAAAATGAWIMCCFSVPTGLNPTPNACKYTTLLGNLLGGSLPTSAALYHLVSGSSDLVQLCALGGITLGAFVTTSGLIAEHLGNTPGSVLYTRVTTIAAFVILLTFFTIVLCTLFSSTEQKVACGLLCGFCILLLVFLWIHFDW